MFLLLTRVLLLFLLGVVIYYLVRIFPRSLLTALGAFVLVIFVLLQFLSPTEPIVAGVWNVLSFPLKPLGLVIVLLIAARRKGFFKLNVADPNLVLAALLILLFTSTPIIANYLAQQAEQPVFQTEEVRQQVSEEFNLGRPVPQEQQTAGAIVVLGLENSQGNLSNGTQIQLTDTGRLITYAAQVYQQQRNLGNDPVAIVSVGPGGASDPNGTGGSDVVGFLDSQGVPRNRIIPETTGIDIRTSAEAVQRLLRQRGLGDRIILVTSAINARRAALTFNQLGIRVIPRATGFFSPRPDVTAIGQLQVSDFVPNVEALMLTTRLWEEFLASIYYFLRGWLTEATF